MKSLHKISLLLLAVLILTACSRKKSTFMSRNFHAVTAEFNALYNGDLAFTEGKADLALTYRDNFWEILPVERIELKEELTLPGEQTNPKFNRAEEKAAKAIQKHSIYVDGKEYNPQIDEAYMLLGKARYYDQRFVASQDAFNFILNRYSTSNSINEARMWKAKSNIRLSNEEGALEELEKLLSEEGLSEEDNADASAIMAQAFINLDSLDAALPLIKQASAYVQDSELKGRYSYIKGQLYNRLGMKDSANMAFQEVIELNRKSPRVYMINAYIAQGRNFDYEKQDRIAFLELLQELEEDRENRPFLDLIYNQMGEYYRNTANIDTAKIFYNKSIKAFSDNNILQSVNYSTLAEISFDAAEYKMAGAYYDSTLTFLEEKTRPWRRVKKKRENLDDVIKYEDIATINDSILRIVAMPEAAQIQFFNDYTARLKAQAIKDSLANVEAKERIENQEFYTKEKKQRNEGGTFYFYNSTTVAYGKSEFTKIWGKRKLEDNWRVSSKKNTLSDNQILGGEEEVTIAESELFKPETYLSKIPKDPKVIDSITGDRNFAYYQLGLIYKEKFREYGLATNRLEKLLSFSPEERLVLPAKYNLYKIYAQEENMAMADKWRNDILNNHSDSRYAEILRNPNTQLATDESSPEFKYKALYKAFEDSRYQYVIDTAEDYITIYTGNDIVPKLEMLKATALARKDGYQAYKKQLNFVALNYPQAEEGKQAQQIYATVLPKLAFKEFVKGEESKWKVVYRFSSTETESAKTLLETLTKAITDYNYTNMTASLDYYDPNTTLVVIHGLNTQLGGRGFAEVLKESKAYRVTRPYFEISRPNYEIVQIHKNLDTYLNEDTIIEESNNPQK